MLLGPSTPLIPLFFERGVDYLSGTLVVDEAAALIAIQQGAAYAQVQGTRATSWSVQKQVQAEKVTSWTVRAPAAGSRSTTWQVRQSATASRTTSWGTAQEVDVSRMTTWAVLAEDWGLPVVISRDFGMTWIATEMRTQTSPGVWERRKVDWRGPYCPS